jgi:RNA polymerase sigma-70 factor (ECF subfamily)
MTLAVRTETLEAELIARAIDGDASAFGDLYERYLDAIYRYVYCNVGDHAEAEDLTEAVFLKAWEALTHFGRSGTMFRAWLYRIARNVIIDRHRTRKPAASLEQFIDLSDGSPTPEAEVETRQEVRKLSAVLARLKPTMRQVVECRFIAGLSHAETAQAIGVSEGNVRAIQHRALRKMRRLWEKE